MITKKVTVTKIIVNRLKVDLEKNKVEYWVGNDIKRLIDLDSSMSVGKNIVRYENLLTLKAIERTNKEIIYWYNGVTNLIINEDSGGYRAWFSNLT